MTELKAGDSFPEGVVFKWVPYKEEQSSIKTSGTPQDYDASKEWADKKVVLFAVPGAFTGTCSTKHLPPYIEHVADFKAKGVDIVACIAYNDAYVMSAWGKANDVKGHDILFLSDYLTPFSQKIGWTKEERTGRYAMIIDHGKVVYAAKEPAKEITVSGAEAVLSKL